MVSRVASVSRVANSCAVCCSQSALRSSFSIAPTMVPQLQAASSWFEDQGEVLQVIAGGVLHVRREFLELPRIHGREEGPKKIPGVIVVERIARLELPHLPRLGFQSGSQTIDTQLAKVIERAHVKRNSDIECALVVVKNPFRLCGC